MAAEDEDLMSQLMGGIDLKSGKATLKKLDLPLAYSPEAVDKVDAEINQLTDKAADLKRSDAPVKKRQAVRDEVDALVNARGLLHRLRPAQPGDVTTAVAPVGGNN